MLLKRRPTKNEPGEPETVSAPAPVLTPEEIAIKAQRDLRIALGSAIWAGSRPGASERFAKLAGTACRWLGMDDGQLRNLRSRASQWRGWLKWCERGPAMSEKVRTIEAEFQAEMQRAEALRRKANEIVENARRKAESDGHAEAKSIANAAEEYARAIGECLRQHPELTASWPIPAAGSTPLDFDGMRGAFGIADVPVTDEDEATIAGTITQAMGLA